MSYSYYSASMAEKMSSIAGAVPAIGVYTVGKEGINARSK